MGTERPAGIKVDGGIGRLEEAATTARAAEAAGYDGAWASEVNSDPFLSLTLAADATSTMQLGTSIAVAFARSPMTLAYTANDLQRFSGGRLALGLGSQVKAHITRRFSMPWSKPAARMREFVLAMQAAWANWAGGEPLRFEGEFYSHTLMPPTFVPAAHSYGRPKVLIAGVGDLMTRVAGEVADGFFCHAFTTPRWVREHTIPALREERHRAGRTMAGFDVACLPFVATGTDKEIAVGVDTLKARIAFYGSTPAYRPVLELDGWGDLGTELHALSRQNRWAEMAALIDDDVLDAFAVVAPPKEVPGKLAERFGGLATRLTFHPPVSMASDDAAELIAALRGIPALSEAAV
jgi:probable F420-dependent oxidoreductase